MTSSYLRVPGTVLMDDAAVDLTVVASGTITQDGGGITVPGTLDLAAGGGNDITLETASNDFGTATVTTGNNVSLVDTNAVILGGTTAVNDLTVVAVGISQSAALDVDGDASFDVALCTEGSSLVPMMRVSLILFNFVSS